MRTSAEQKSANLYARLAQIAHKLLLSFITYEEVARPRGIEPLFAP